MKIKSLLLLLAITVAGSQMSMAGSIKGKVTVSDLTFLKAPCHVMGDILTGKLVVEVGATFTGSCNMGAVIKDIHEVDNGHSQGLSAV